jgi:hypothetical protein
MPAREEARTRFLHESLRSVAYSVDQLVYHQRKAKQTGLSPLVFATASPTYSQRTSYELILSLRVCSHDRCVDALGCNSN